PFRGQTKRRRTETMRNNLHHLFADFKAAATELDQAVEARISGSFRKVWIQDEREFSALKKVEEIAASINETVSYCVVLQKSLRANRVDMAQRTDHLSADFMTREQRLL